LVGEPLWSKPLLDGETNRDVLVVGVADVPEKSVPVLELYSVECSSHANVNAAYIIDGVNDVSLGLVLDEQRQVAAVNYLIIQVVDKAVSEDIVSEGLEYRRLGSRLWGW